MAVTITPAGVRRAMAATAMAFLLSLAHRILEKDRITRAGQWATKLDYMGYQVTGKNPGHDRPRQYRPRPLSPCRSLGYAKDCLRSL